MKRENDELLNAFRSRPLIGSAPPAPSRPPQPAGFAAKRRGRRRRAPRRQSCAADDR